MCIRDRIQVYPLEQIWAQIEYLPYRSARDPAAVLVQSIREAWAPPAAYMEQRRLMAEQEAARRAAAVAERGSASERARLREAAQAVFEQLRPDDRRLVEREIEAILDENYKFLRGWEGHPVYRAVYREELLKVIRRRWPDRLAERLRGMG